MNKVYFYQSLVLKELKAICKLNRLNIGAIKLRKLNLQTCIPWERGVFILHPLTYPNLGFHIQKTETYKLVKAGALEGFLFGSSFAYDACFNAFVLFLVLYFVWRTIENFSAFTVTRNAAKISFVRRVPAFKQISTGLEVVRTV